MQNEINIARKLTLPEENCFVHGDLDCSHLIFEGKKLIGIIDWGDTDITTMRILVIGGTKFIGPYVVKSLHEKGNEVILFNRGQTIHHFPLQI